jgi:hypothetical protein
MASDKDIPVQTVVDAAVAAHAEQLDAAANAGTLTQVQADTMKQLMRSRIETQLQSATGFGRFGPGMTGGFGFGPGRRVKP